MSNFFQTIGNSTKFQLSKRGTFKERVNNVADPADLFGFSKDIQAVHPDKNRNPSPPPAVSEPARMPVPDDQSIQKQQEIEQAKRSRLSGRVSTQNPGSGTDSLG